MEKLDLECKTWLRVLSQAHNLLELCKEVLRNNLTSIQ